jgi:hypothetical protein
MSMNFHQSSPFLVVHEPSSTKPRGLFATVFTDIASGAFVTLLTWLVLIISGCGAGGYPGGGIEALSASAITIDAGQSYKFTTMVDGSPTVAYSLSGTSCSAGSCGSLSNTTGTTVVYTAPPGITTQIGVTMTAAVTGTKSSATVAITVNPDPTLNGVPPAGTVGVPYTANLNPAGGTAPLALSIASGSLPPGLVFNATTGAITGTPTSVGTFAFAAQLLDSSAVPYLLTAQETIVVSAPIPPPIVLSGNPPAGTVGSAYSTAFSASGGVAPYSFSVLSGSLPAGLTLASGGILAGTPTSAGVSVFTLQAQDSIGTKGSAVFSITITSMSLSLTISTLPSGTVNVPYSSNIGVTGGTAPYSCTIVSGTIPAGLTLTAAGCLVSGTPTTAGTANLSVKATDSSNPQETTTGPVSLTINPAGSLTLTSPPAGTVSTPYTGMIGVSGGTSPYSCLITAGTLPAGLSISNCTITGTPTVAGTTTITVKGTDSSSPTALTTTGPVILVINPAALTLAVTSLPNGTVNVPYSSTIGVNGGTAPYACTITSGTLPAGLTLTAAGCIVSGTPTVAGTVNLMVKATDSSSPQETTTGPVSLTINPASLIIALSSLPNGTVNVPYSSNIGVTGGTSPYSCVITNGTLPAGLTLTAAGCLVSGTPTVATTVHLTVKATDSSSPQETTTGPVNLTINPAAATLTLTSPPAGTVNTPYTGTIVVSGGTSPYSCTITAGTLPAGLTISNCTISGTPTTPGTTTITVKGTDSGNPQGTVTGPVTVTINPAALSLTVTTLPNGTVDVPYSSTIGVTGGTSPYSCTIVAGTIPAGLTLTAAGCLVSGTPTTAGTATLSVKATDSSNPQETTTRPVSITINPAGSLTLTSPPAGTVSSPYNGTIGVSGGNGPYTCSITAGTLPTGLTISNCTITGTPTTAGTTTITVKGTDSSTPTPLTTTGPITLVINPAPLSLTISSLPNGVVNVPYSSTIGVTGGTSPYSCTIVSGTLPAGLTLTAAGCLVSGTPTVVGTVNLSVKATDSSNPQETTTGPVSLTINPAPLSLTVTSLPNGTVDVPYSSNIGVAGGTAPYSCTIVSGTIPAGLTLTAAGCLVSGTPTTAGTANLSVKVTDSGNPQQTTTGPVSITINPAGSLTLTSPPAGTVNTPYTGTIGVTGGTSPYTCTITAGTLPAGLTISNCTITGTPTTAGTTTLTVKATDSSTPTALTTTGPVTLVINPPAPTLTLTSPPPATVDTPYTGTIGVTGGTGPYTCTVLSGAVPAGLTINNQTITGTPTTAGSSTLSVKCTDSSNPTVSTTGPVTITVQPLPPLTFTGTLPSATVNVPYSQTLTAQGGLAPYTYAITAGALPPGITLDPTTGVISGTPTVVGASSFTDTATDSETPKQTASLPLILQVLYPTTPNDSELDGPYAYLFQGYDDVVAGVLAYQTATVGSFTADGLGGISAGELDANHQSSNPTGATVSSSNFLGTYTIGTDNRGSLTITALKADGTTGATTTYAIAVKAPVSPATITVEGSLIESDDNQIVGTKGSGTFLAQTPAAYTAGLTGSYAFGVSGDTPCLPSCTIGIIAGPAATVGQFTTNGAGALTGGTSDTNIATTNIANSPLSGTYSTADTNGRLELSMTTADLTGIAYPTDFAVYLVNANQAFILSTDKHSAYILLAGSAQLQTVANFGDAPINGPFIGYENSIPDPGILGVTLQNVLNFSTATIFRGTGASNGNCTITNVDTGGVTSLISGVSGILGSLTGLSGILGAYTHTGAATCPVTANGRGVLQYPVATLLGLPVGTPPAPRVFYLSSANTGYFLETSYAGLGKLEAQTGAPFSEANTFTGTYVYGSAPASSLASINTSGIIKSNGAGMATSTLDLNIGVGTINVIELGQTSTQPYSAPDPTTGRFTLGSAGTIVIYAINPNRFVLLDTNPLTTSPSVSVLY